MKKILTSICVALIASFIIVEITSCKEVVEEHVHDIVEVKEKDATCTEDGNIAYYECSSCDKFFSDSKGEKEIDKNSVVIASKGHSLVKTEAIDSTCESSGNIEYYKCSVCGKLFSDAEGKNEISADALIIPATGHKLDKVNAVVASCESSANIEYYKCSICGKLFSDADGKNEISADAVIIPATGHKLDKVNAVVASCESAGNIEYYKCSICGKLFSDADGKNEISADDVIIPASHKLDKVEAVAASCESAGNIEYYKCSICGKLFSDADGKNEISADAVIIPATGHKLDKVNAVVASCESAGNIEYYKCSVCNKLFSDAEGKNEISADDVIIPAAGHKLSKVEAVSPSCESAGNIEYYKCSICGKLFSDAEGKNEISEADIIIAALGHSIVKVDAVEATCESDGNIEYYKCSICNKLFSDAEGKNEISAEDVIIPASHKLDKVEVVEASCESAGNIEYYKCSICGKLFSDAEGKNEISEADIIIAALGHSIVKVDAVEATCELDGNIEYYKCSICNKLFSDAEGKNEISEDGVVIKASHKYVAGEIVEPTASTAGSIAVSCSVCGVADSIVLPELVEENYNNGFYDYRVDYALAARVSAISGKRNGIYIYNNDDLNIHKEFSIQLSTFNSVGRLVDLSSGSYNGTFSSTYLRKNTTLDEAKYGIGLSNTSDGVYYKFTITSPLSDVVVTLISSDGAVEDVIVSAAELSALLQLDSSAMYLIIIHSAADSSQNIEYTIEETEVPKISNVEGCNIGTLQGGNVSGGDSGSSIDVVVADSVAAGTYTIALYGNNLIGRSNFNIIVNGETISTTNKRININGVNQISAACTITINPGDVITIVSMNLTAISNINVILIPA